MKLQMFWTLAAGGAAYMKQHKVSLLIRLDTRGQRWRSYETTKNPNSKPQNVEVWNRFAQSFLK
jgi:hypothetical protein